MWLYLKRMYSGDRSEDFLKIGVTSHADTNDRFSYGKQSVFDSDLSIREKIEKMMSGVQYISDHPYEIESIHQVEYLYEGEALIAEQELLNIVKSSQYYPRKSFSGHSECFLAPQEQITNIVAYMDEHSGQANKNAPNDLKYKYCAMGIYEDDPILKHRKILEKYNKEFGGS